MDEIGIEIENFIEAKIIHFNIGLTVLKIIGLQAFIMSVNTL